MRGPGSFWTERKRAIAVYMAVALPATLLLAGGAIDITSVMSERGRLRSIAEGAALAGAGDLALASDRSIAAERAKAWAQTEIAEWESAPASVVAAEVIAINRSDRGVRVSITANRPSIFGRLMPPGDGTSASKRRPCRSGGRRFV